MRLACAGILPVNRRNTAWPSYRMRALGSEVERLWGLEVPWGKCPEALTGEMHLVDKPVVTSVPITPKLQCSAAMPPDFQIIRTPDSAMCRLVIS